MAVMTITFSAVSGIILIAGGEGGGDIFPGAEKLPPKLLPIRWNGGGNRQQALRQRSAAEMLRHGAFPIFWCTARSD